MCIRDRLAGDKEETNENNQQTNESLKQINKRFDRNDAVSYTHLDVYKRQHFRYSFIGFAS